MAILEPIFARMTAFEQKALKHKANLAIRQLYESAVAQFYQVRQAQKAQAGDDGQPPTCEALVDACPNQEIGYLRWMIRCVGRGEIDATSLERASSVIALFHRLKVRPFFLDSGASSDLYNYKTFHDLSKAVEAFQGIDQRQRREERKKQEYRAQEERLLQEGQVRIVANTPSFKIVRLFSTAAAQFYGRKTQWCTASAQAPNGFYAYAAQGPVLRIFIKGSPEKYGFNFSAYHFVDQNNQDVDLLTFLTGHPEIADHLEPYFDDMLHYDVTAFLSSLPPRFQSPERAKKALLKSATKAALLVPDACWTAENVRLAMKKDPLIFPCLPKVSQNKRLRIEAVRRGVSLFSVDKAYRTDALAFEALRFADRAQSHYSIQDVMDYFFPNAKSVFYDPGLDWYIDTNFENVQKRLDEEKRYGKKAKSIWRALVQRDGNLLQFVMRHHRDAKIERMAIRQNGMAIGYAKYRTPEIQQLAVRQNGMALKHIPPQAITETMILEALGQNGLALMHVPEDALQDSAFRKEAYALAVGQNGLALEYIPQDLQTPDLCSAAVKNNAKAWKYVAAAQRTKPLMLQMLSQDGCRLNNIDASQWDEQLCLAALKQTSRAFRYVLTRPEYLTEKVMETALRAWRRDFRKNPSKAQFPFLPPRQADQLAHAIGLRFHPDSGKMSLGPANWPHLRRLLADKPSP